jgi:hypothetical protein
LPFRNPEKTEGKIIAASASPLVSIVVLNWNGEELIKECPGISRCSGIRANIPFLVLMELRLLRIYMREPKAMRVFMRARLGVLRSMKQHHESRSARIPLFKKMRKQYKVFFLKKFLQATG